MKHKDGGAQTPIKVVVTKTPLDITAVCLAVAALAAFTVSVWQSRELQKHFRLLVRPYIEFDSYTSTNGPFLGIGLSNEGTGPAIVRSAALCLDGKPLDSSNGNGWPIVTERLGLAGSKAYYTVLSSGDVIKEGQRTHLFGYGSSRFSEERRKLIREVVPRIEYKICYCSLYDECWELAASYLGRRSHLRVETCRSPSLHKCLEPEDDDEGRSLARNEAELRSRVNEKATD